MPLLCCRVDPTCLVRVRSLNQHRRAAEAQHQGIEEAVQFAARNPRAAVAPHPLASPGRSTLTFSPADLGAAAGRPDFGMPGAPPTETA